MCRLHLRITRYGGGKVSDDPPELSIVLPCYCAMDAGHRVLRYDDHTTDRCPDDNGCIFLHAVDANWDVFLVALFLDRLQRTHLD